MGYKPFGGVSMRCVLLLATCVGVLAAGANAGAGSTFVDYQITAGSLSPATGSAVSVHGGSFRVRFGYAVGPSSFSFPPTLAGSGWDLSLLSLDIIGAGQNLRLLGSLTRGYFSAVPGRAYFRTDPNFGPARWRTGPALSQLWRGPSIQLRLSPIAGAVGFDGDLILRGLGYEHPAYFSLQANEVARTFVPDAPEPPLVFVFGGVGAALGGYLVLRRRTAT